MRSLAAGIEEVSLVLPQGFNPLATRSVLASLKPRGTGSPYRESLSSYFMRLADQHCFSPKLLAREFVVPMLGLARGVEATQADRFWRTSFFNGMGTVPDGWVRALSCLTGVKGLRQHTLLPLQGLVSRFGTASQNRRWCPHCLREGEEDGTPYGQLLWEIGAVRACPLHEVKLVSRCGCGPDEAQSPLRIKHLHHLCASCGRSLAWGEGEPLEPASAEEVRFARKVAALLGCPFFDGEVAPPGATGFRKVIEAACHEDLAGSPAGLARMLGVSKATTWDWVHGKHLPSLGQVYATAEALNLSMEEVLTGRGSVKLIVRQDLVQREREAVIPNRPTWLGEDLRNAMEVLSRALPPMSLAEVARMLRISPRELYRRERDLSREITMRAILARAKEARVGREKQAKRFRAVVAEIAGEGLHPSLRRVEERMGTMRVFILNSEHRRELLDASGDFSAALD